MARLPRLALPAQLHLVRQRGNNGERIVVDDADRRTCLEMLGAAAVACGLAVHGYALLDDELHLLATPAAEGGLSRAMQTLGRRYVVAFNRRHGRTGTLWEGRFRSAPVEAESTGIDALVHLERAPLRHGLAASAAAWPWSSAAHHLGQRRDPLVADLPVLWALGNTPFEREAAYRRRLDAGLSAAREAQIDGAQKSGWPLGSPAFLAALGGQTARPVAARRPGRRRAVAGGTAAA